ncbi:MAG: 30S ribosomal protein S18 [Candidatus Pacebacteria bacterium]|nr:30S ribosomal protein S18 [Candidatus Paceibacterota bacterium]
MKSNKQCYFTSHGIKHIDYKDTELLKKFLSPNAKILPRKRTGVSSKYQRQLSLAIKHARFMGFLPYIQA